jgi:hypothetical protein
MNIEDGVTDCFAVFGRSLFTFEDRSEFRTSHRLDPLAMSSMNSFATMSPPSALVQVFMLAMTWVKGSLRWTAFNAPVINVIHSFTPARNARTFASFAGRFVELNQSR